MLILYGSQGGNAADYAEQLARCMFIRGFAYRFQAMNEYQDLSLLKQESVVLFVVSTTGEGEMPDNAKTFWRSLLQKDLPLNLNLLKYAVFGLGDSSYEQ